MQIDESTDSITNTAQLVIITKMVVAYLYVKGVTGNTPYQRTSTG